MNTAVKRIGEYLVDEQIINPEQLQDALKYQKSIPGMKIGDILIHDGVITAEQFKSALARQALDQKKTISSILIDMDLVDKRTVNRLLARKLGVPFVDASNFQVDPAVVELIPYDIAAQHGILPLYRQGNSLYVAMEDPSNEEIINQLRFFTGMKVQVSMALEEDIKKGIEVWYSGKGSVDISEMAASLIDDTAAAAEEAQVEESDSVVVKLVNKLILDAKMQGASDIHIEPTVRKGLLVRFRKDGDLYPYFEFPSNVCSAMVSRIKIMAHLDISEKRKPQDGKMVLRNSEMKIELRVATLPMMNAEAVVMRILSDAKALPIDAMDLEPVSLEAIKRLAQKPYGLFLVCGPTGSGKTTTLHSILGYINTPEKKIWTAEDPVEIVQDGLCQVQVSPKIGLTFAAAMRSFLRADPDVIMVGEMRDKETTGTGIEASLTGHLVLSTLHTNSAPESVTRLLDLGMDPFNFADALLGILAQRLAKRLCVKCKKSYAAGDEEIRLLAEEYCGDYGLDPEKIRSEWIKEFAKADGKLWLWNANGCEECSGSGYRGRIGLHELMVSSEVLRKMIQNRATVADLARAAIGEGMRTLKQDGIRKVLRGLTDMKQIRSVCG